MNATSHAANMLAKSGFAFLLSLVACAHAAFAQASLDSRDAGAREVAGVQSAGGAFGLEKSVNEFSVWGGGSLGSPTLIGKTEETRLAILGLRYARVLARGDNLALKYTIDAVPVASLSYPDGGTFTAPARERRKTITGAGLSPVGFQLNFRRRERIQPFAQASGGFLYFGERVPDERGAQFNFTADFGGGVQWKTGARRAWTVGYRYQHISNGYRAEANPGFDANLIYVGFSIFR
ncbi:MAG TPA: acyloxyacyl hydrolase [Pyrinomonadaceae bacterium]|nr:acyloxyacyl hydrolase [Pyrinomonadaceae bacterium]